MGWLRDSTGVSSGAGDGESVVSGKAGVAAESDKGRRWRIWVEGSSVFGHEQGVLVPASYRCYVVQELLACPRLYQGSAVESEIGVRGQRRVWGGGGS